MIPSNFGSSNQLGTHLLYQPQGVILLVLRKLEKSLTVPCTNVPFFIPMSFRYVMTPIKRKIHRKTGSHNVSKIISAMLKRVESKKCTLPIRHNEAVPKIHIMDFWQLHVTVPIWIQSI